MIWLIGIIGFVCGFALGLLALNRMLEGRTKSELLHDRGLQFRYGLFAWIVAGGCSYGAVLLYKIYFPAF